MPSSNTRYWTEKRAKNRARDEKRTRELEAMGWRVLRLWEHEVTKEPEECVGRIEKVLRDQRGSRRQGAGT